MNVKELLKGILLRLELKAQVPELPTEPGNTELEQVEIEVDLSDFEFEPLPTESTGMSQKEYRALIAVVGRKERISSGHNYSLIWLDRVIHILLLIVGLIHLYIYFAQG